MRGWLVPPECRDHGGGASLPLTPEWLTLASLLAVTLPVTASGFASFAPVVVPCTALVAVAFWYRGRRVTRPGPMLVYCLAAGAVLGALNGCLSVLCYSLLFPGHSFIGLEVETFALAALYGAVIGFAYGTAYLLPMLIQLSARSLRRTEAIDRCLAWLGAWGMVILVLDLSATGGSANPKDWPLDAGGAVTLLGSAGIHAAMLAVGVLRSTRRRSWLARVVQGKVPGWLVCEPQRFHSAALKGLELFCHPFGRKNPDDFKVLARSGTTTSGEAYRSAATVPKFFIA